MKPRLMQIVLDAPDHRALAEFYREFLGYSYREGSESMTGAEPEWIEIEDRAAGQRLAFQRSGQHRRPLVYNRVETFDASGTLIDTVLRKVRLRWWSQDQFIDALSAAGFVDIEMVGDHNAWVTIAQRPR